VDAVGGGEGGGVGDEVLEVGVGDHGGMLRGRGESCQWWGEESVRGDFVTRDRLVPCGESVQRDRRRARLIAVLRCS
jgi:hypothetical protein